MIKKLQLSDSQYEGYGRILDDRAVQGAREKRYLQFCLIELGGRMDEPWRFDETFATFFMEVPDDTKLKEPNAPTADSGAKTPLGKDVAG